MDTGSTTRRLMESLMTVEEVAQHLGVSSRTVRRMIANQEMTATRLGRRIVRVTHRALRDYLNARTDPF